MLMEHLPEIRGRYTENAPLGEKGWFRCGGKAEVLFKPADQDDLIHFLKNYNPSPDFADAQLPSPMGRGKATEREQGEGGIHIFGALSNTIIRDGGLKGVTIRMGRAFADIEVDGDHIKAGALALDSNVANMAAEHGIGGLEFFSGIPGAIGGALKMNAGCYGTETKDVLVEAELLSRDGMLRIVTPDDLDMSYRHTNIEDDIVLSATFKGVREEPSIVKARIEQIKAQREDSQPIREKTGGSTFANPSAEELSQAGLEVGTKVWELIDSVGGRGLTIGGAQMSEKHCNFMINTGNATAADLEALGEEIRSRVLDKHGIALRWEIRRLGDQND